MIFFVILAIVILFALASTIYGIRGWRHGWKDGARSAGFIVLSGVLAYLLAHPIASMAKNNFIATQGTNETLNILKETGFYTPALENIIDATAFNYHFTTTALSLFLLFLVIEIVTTLVIRVVRKNKQEVYQQPPKVQPSPIQQTVSIPNENSPAIPTPIKKSKGSWLGLGLGFCVAGLICLTSFLIAKINFFTEANNIQKVMNITTSYAMSKGNMKVILNQSDEIVDLFFDSTLIVGTQEDKLEVANHFIRNYAALTENPLIIAAADNIEYTSKDEVKKDLKNMLQVMELLDEDNVNNVTKNILEKLKDYFIANKDVSKLVETLKKLGISETEIKTLFEDIIKEITDKDGFSLDGVFDYSEYRGDIEDLLKDIKSIESLLESFSFSAK